MTGTMFRMVAATALLLAGPVTARAATAETGQVQAAPGVSIYYERHGTGPNFVLVPNLMAMPEMRALARPDRTLVLYDMRNRGRSGRVEDLSAITIMGDVDDVEALRRHFGAERLSLVGYSYLGLMVALYAVRHPDRVERLVQVGAVPRRFGTAYPPDQTAGLSTLDAAGRAAESAWRSLRENPPAGTTPLDLCRAQRRSWLLPLAAVVPARPRSLLVSGAVRHQPHPRATRASEPSLLPRKGVTRAASGQSGSLAGEAVGQPREADRGVAFPGDRREASIEVGPFGEILHALGR